MLIKRLNDIIGSERDVPWGNGQSRRLLLESDGMGFSVTDTLIEAGTESRLEYKHHLEACYCVEGRGEVVSGGEIYPLEPGILYALDRNDPHILRATETLRLVCVFVPPLRGHEKHDLSKDGHSHY